MWYILLIISAFCYSQSVYPGGGIDVAQNTLNPTTVQEYSETFSKQPILLLNAYDITEFPQTGISSQVQDIKVTT